MQLWQNPYFSIQERIMIWAYGIYKSFKDLQWPDEMVSDGDGSVLSAKPSQKLWSYLIKTPLAR